MGKIYAAMMIMEYYRQSKTKKLQAQREEQVPTTSASPTTTSTSTSSPSSSSSSSSSSTPRDTQTKWIQEKVNRAAVQYNVLVKSVKMYCAPQQAS